jgi:hypothetical protein
LVPIFDIEYELEKRFVKGLRAIFENDDVFSYNSNDEDTKVIITTDYPQKDAPGKTPHIIVTDVGYNINTQNFFGNNFYRDFATATATNGAQEFVNIIPYSINLVSLGEWSLSKDLGSKVAQYVSFIAFDYLSETLELHIQSIGKNPTAPHAQYPEHIFQTTISLQGNLYWAGAKGPGGFLAGLDTPVQNIQITKNII